MPLACMGIAMGEQYIAGLSGVWTV